MRPSPATRLFALAPIALAVGLALGTYRVATPCYVLERDALPSLLVARTPVGQLAVRSERRSQSAFPLDENDYLDLTCAIGPFTCDYHAHSYHGRPWDGTLYLDDPKSCSGASLELPLGMYTAHWDMGLDRAGDGDLFVIAARSPYSHSAAPVAFHRRLVGPLGRLGWRAPALIPLLFAAAVVGLGERGKAIGDALRWAALAALAAAIALLVWR